MAKQSHIGGSFAPPLTDAKLAGYRDLIDALPPSAVRDAMDALHKCCAAWWELPESTGTATRAHGSGVGTIVDLDEGAKKSLYDLIPWAHELAAMGTLFDGIDPKADKALRDAAHHLLWHAIELEQDREPLTADKL